MSVSPAVRKARSWPAFRKARSWLAFRKTRSWPAVQKARSWIDRLWPPMVLIVGLIAAAAWTAFLAYETVMLIARMI